MTPDEYRRLQVGGIVVYNNTGSGLIYWQKALVNQPLTVTKKVIGRKLYVSSDLNLDVALGMPLEAIRFDMGWFKVVLFEPPKDIGELISI